MRNSYVQRLVCNAITTVASGALLTVCAVFLPGAGIVHAADTGSTSGTQPQTSPSSQPAADTSAAYKQPWRNADNDPDIVQHDKKSGMYVGAGLGFGQSRAAKGGTTPGVSFKGSIEPGYMRQFSSWSHMELSGEVFFGNTGFRKSGDDGYKASMPIGLGILAKAGYGYSLGSSLKGIWKVGVGPVMAKYSADAANDVEIESKGAVWGTAGHLAFLLGVPVSDAFDFTGGVELTHMAFDIGDLRVKSGGETSTDDSGETVNLNVWQAVLGMRLKL